MSLLPRIRGAAVGRELAAACFFIFLSVLMTWPLALSPARYVSDAGDPWLNAWIVDWVQRAAFTKPWALFHAPIFYPSAYSLAFSEHLIGVALVTAPFRLLGLGPIFMHSVALILGFAGSGYGMWVLARMTTRSAVAALVAGTFYAFVPYRFDQLPHLQHAWSIWIPLLLAALIHYSRQPSLRRAALFGGAFLMNGLTNVHWFVFGSFAAVVTAFFIAAVRRQIGSKQYWVPISIATLGASMLLLPFLLPYRAASEMYDMKRAREEALNYSADWADWLRSTPRSRVYGSLSNALDAPAERKLFPGLLAILLAAAAIVRARPDDFEVRPYRRDDSTGPPRVRLLRFLDALIVLAMIFTYWGMAADRVHWRIGEVDVLRASGASVPAMVLMLALLVRLWIRYPAAWGGSLATTIRSSRLPLWFWIAVFWVALGLIGSLGMNAFFHTLLFQKIEIFRSIRVPARWAMIVYTGLAMLVAAGVTTLLRDRSRPARAAVASVFVLLFLVELRAAPILWYPSPPSQPEVYDWIRELPLRGAVLELPIGHDVWVEGPYLLGQTVHRKELMNGFSGFEPPVHRALVERFSEQHIDPALFGELESLGCSVIVVHADRLGEQRAGVLAWLRDGLTRGKITFLGHHPHHIRGDWVFGVPRVDPAVAAMQPPDAADGAGRRPRENLDLLLSGDEPIYNDGTFGRIDTVRDGEQIVGSLGISGWALSPHGVRAVNVRLEGESLKIPARLVPRADVVEKYPWYPANPTPGFELEIPRRPDGVSRETYLQVEIVDGRGERAYLDPLFITWP